MASGDNFMASPLVLWVETFLPERSPSLKPNDLYDGVFLSDVLQQIDPRPSHQNVNREVEDDHIRLQNWDLLIKNIRAYYTDVLQQLIVTKMPNIQTICHQADKDASFDELKKVILLILGCAVQCERKERFIENIKLLDLDVQHAIVEHIKEVTDDSETVLHIDPPEQLEEYTEKMFSHVTRLIKERDDYAEVISDLIQERDYYHSQAEGQTTVVSTSPEKHHLAVELAEFKAKLRHARQELEDKSEQLTDLREEIDTNKETISKLRAENLDLVQDARSARTYRDELDVYKEKASKVDKYESEITKYKEKLDQLEFFKSRVDELRADNAILVDTKTMLTEQLTSSHKRVETVIELENELIKYRQQIQHFSTQRDSDRETIQELTEEIARLEFAKKNSMDESATLEQELEDAKKMVSGKGGTLSEQMQETANTKILRLELENQRLQQKVDEMKEKALIENSAINLELEKENQRLAKKVEKLQETSSSKVQEVLEFEAKERELTEEKNTLVQTIETVKENSERQVRELEQENMHLNETLQTLRERNEKTNDLRIREIEKENKRLHESVNSLTSQNSTLDFENRQLQKSYDRLKESADKISVIEHENDSLEKENNDLYQEVATLRLSVEKYRSLEEENSDLDVDNRKLCKTVEHLQLELNKKEKLEQENINLTVETERLKRAHELSKNSSDSTIQDLEKEKEDLSTELQHVKKMFEAHKIERAKYEQMELDLLDIDGEKHKIIKSLESTSRRVQQLEQDNNDLELENEKLQKTVENLKLSLKKLEQVERENSELDQRVSDISKHKSNLEKENKKIKQTLELKESELDEILIKSSSLEQEVKSLRKVADQSKDVGSRVKELEKENKDFFQQMSMEKKTVSSLREDLLNEKLRTQQLTNELETLNHELEHIGIDRDKLAIAQTSKNENRYKALESIMEETLSKNMEIKEEKIRSLESRLEEFRSRYQKQQLELRAVTRECDVLKQRCEEETLVKAETTSPGSRPIPPPKPGNPNRDFLKLKDHLVDVERSNATLIAENKSLKSHNDSLNQQLHRMESQSSSVQSHVMSLQGQTNSIQTENAKLQVENTTLQSQCASFMSQVTGLQNQFSSLESDHERLINSHEQLQSAHEQLASDHETLQRLHERLTQEYEHLVAKHGAVKSQLKSAKDEVKDLQDQAYGHSQEKNDVNKQRSSLEREREQLKLEQKSLGNLQMDYNRLRDDHDHLKNTHENLNRDFGDVLTELKNTKSEYNTLQVHHTELQGSFADCREQIHALQVDIVKLEDKCESYSQINTRLDEDNRGLMLQVQTLLNQNQELLTQALESKDHLGETEKAYLEKLADLRRQKEKLEEKIMEQYKMGRWDMSPRKKGGIGSTLVRKAKGLITRAHRSRSRPNLNESPDSSSVGSYGENTDDGNKKSFADRRKSAGYLNDSSNLASMNKSLAKSTTALNCEPNSFRDGRSNSVGEDEGGFVGTSSSHVNGKASPGSKMMSLEEFLRESNGSPETRRKEQDSDSRDGSDSMERGGRSRSQPPPQPRRRAPQPPNEYPSTPRGQIVLSPPSISQDHLPTPRGRNVSSPPPISQDDLPTPRGRSVSSTPPVPQDHPTTPRGRNVSSPPPLSHDQTDLNMSRMSRISASSMGSSSEDRQELYNNNIFSNKTSTPKMNNEESQVAYERTRFNNRPGSAVNDPSRRQSTNVERASANTNSSSHDPTYASANNLHNRQPPQSQYNRSQSKSPAPDYSTWNGRERAMSPPRSSRSPGPAQQLFTNNLGSRNAQNYFSPNRPASALPFHGRRTPVERERPPYPGQMSSQGTPQKPKSYTPQPVSRIASAANINRERSPQANRPSGDYIHKPSPSYPPNYTPVTSQRISNGAGDNNMGRQLPSTPSSGGNYGAPPSGRMTPTAKPPMQRQLVPESSPNNHSYSPNNHGYPSNTNQNSYSNQPVLRGDQRQVTQATNQGGPPVPTPRQSHPSSRYADVSQNSPAHTQSVSKGLNGPEGQRPLQSRTQQPVVLASRLSYPANGRGPTNLTPMARIQPQTKLNNNNLSGPPSKSSSSPEGSEPKGPKENSVWPRAHRV